MTNQIETIMALAFAYRMADTVDLWPTERDLMQALEAALKPDPEPVAWMDSSGHPRHIRHLQSAEERRLYGELQPLYAAPPAQTPVEKS
jgi:hypothetical protein